MDYIKVKGAKENNLKNVDCVIPKNKFIVATGVSGSGKTSFAFDTIYKEGQRRYIESLSSYARQFLGDLGKPNVESVEGLSPAISIDQKSGSKNPRSTVGTITEITDYLRLLFSKIGTPYCPNHHIPIVPETIDEMVEKSLEYEKEKAMILSPIASEEKGTFENTFSHLRMEGYSRAIVDGVMLSLEDDITLKKTEKHTILAVIDRLAISSEDRNRLHDSLELALKLSDGLAVLRLDDKDITFSSKHSCPICGFTIPDMEPRLFSFNSPIGACKECSGLGFKRHINPDLLVPDKTLSVEDGVFEKWAHDDTMSMIALLSFMESFSIPKNVPFKDLTEEQKSLLLYGSEKSFSYTYKSKSTASIYKIASSKFEGIVRNLERRYLETQSRFIREWLEQYMVDDLCPVCQGKRLNEAALSVLIDGYNIDDLTSLSVDNLYEKISSLKLSERNEFISHMILKEIKERLEFLSKVGLGYLSLNRMSATLSGGEAQRIRLATQIGSKLTGIIYVLDEPSIGLHQKDNQKLIEAMKEMRDLGNTLLIVEHDTETIENADYILDFGPYAGVHGGELVYSGTYEEMIKTSNTLTAKFLRGDLKIEVPKGRKKPEEGYIEVKGATCHNLKNIDAKFPVGLITYVTGVSGSGKSSLVNDCLSKGIEKEVFDRKTIPGDYLSIEGKDKVKKIIIVDQSPIGRTPRSNPATYIGVFDEIRSLFAEAQESKIRGYNKSRFSFNVKGGRCESCGGDGVTKIEMHFLPDVYVECEECHGKKYNRDTLEIKFKGKNIADVLDLTVDEALEFFSNQPKIKRQLETMSDVGLGYIKLGQNSTTLSGGEAQRVKLANELNRSIIKDSLYILDEPSTGLHQYDIEKLLQVLKKINDAGATIVVIEHNLDMIKTADYIIDLGPEGGDKGGYIIGDGTPEELCLNENSDTGRYLKKVL
ncbi:MAG: excinuclease ABC subunit UvrA [Bacillales bacterium]|nr:excinuclease ABC subunit UvrA [Bacillales bacterium]